MYEKLIPLNHELRYVFEAVDFLFLHNELKDRYCSDNGKNATSPRKLFKYLILKIRYKLSDVNVVKRSLYDLSFKYFLGMSPNNTDLIDQNLLTYFRRIY